jgi:hypothetical protein
MRLEAYLRKLAYRAVLREPGGVGPEKAAFLVARTDAAPGAFCSLASSGGRSRI